MPPLFMGSTTAGFAGLGKFKYLFREEPSLTLARAGPVLDTVRRELLWEMRKIGHLLQNGCQNIIVAYTRNESSHPLRELKLESSTILRDVRRLAIECATILADTSQSLELALGMPPQMEVAREFEALAEMHQNSLRAADEMEARLVRLLQDIRRIMKSAQVELKSDIRPLLMGADEFISKLVRPIPPLNSQTATLLDNSSVPGLLELLLALLPIRSVLRINELIEGKRTEIRPERYQGKSVPTRRPRELSLLKCVLGVGYNLRKDLLLSSRTLDPKRGRDGQAHAQRMTVAFTVYSMLREALMGFSHSLASDKGKAGQVPSSSGSAGAHSVVAWLRWQRSRSRK